MIRPITVVSVLIALCAGTSPSMAQVVVGGANSPSVEVDLSVLDNLGPPPNIAGMVNRGGQPAGQSVSGSTDGVVFKPYASGHSNRHHVKRDKQRSAAAKKAAPAPAAAESVKSEPVASRSKEAPTQPAAQVVPAPTGIQHAVTPAVTTSPTPATPKAIPVADVRSQTPAPQSVPVASNPPPPPAVPVAAPVPAAASAPASSPAATVAPATVAPPPVAAAVPVPPKAAPIPVGSTAKGDTVSVVFSPDAVQVPDSAHGDLVSLAQKMAKDDSLSLQLLAYAHGDGDNVSKARRISLSRALEVRRFLMEKGIRSTRIDVRALGNKVEGSGPADRVDAVITAH